MADQRETGRKLSWHRRTVRLNLSLRSGLLWIGRFGWIVPTLRYVEHHAPGEGTRPGRQPTVHMSVRIRRWHPFYWLWLWSQRRAVDSAVVDAIELLGDDIPGLQMSKAEVGKDGNG